MLNLIQGKQINVELTGSFSGSFTGILQGTSSWSGNSVSSSFATTASYLLTSPVFTGSFTPTSSFNYFTSSYNTGSFTGSFSGSFFGTSSWAFDSSRTLSASFASYSTVSVSSSFSNTSISASWAPSQVVNTGSFITTSSFNYFTSSYNTGSFRGDLIGTSSWSGNSVSSSFATTASYLSGNFTLDRVSNISASSAQNYNILIFSTSSLLWESKNPFSEFAANPIKYGEHVNIPTFGAASHNNVEGVTLAFNGATARTWNDSNLVTRTQRLGIVSNTNGTVGGQFRQITQYMSRNSGFSVTSGFNMAENAADVDIRFLICIRNAIGLFANVEPDTLTNFVGFCRLSTSNNIGVVHNDDTGLATVIDLGSNFPANTESLDKYRFVIETVPTGIYVKIERLGTVHVYEKVLTSDIPAADLGLTLGGYIVNLTGVNASTGFDWHGSYVKVG